MVNPIAQRLSQSNNLLNNISNIKQMLQGKDTNAVLLQMLQTNPQFKSFYEENKNKSVDEIAKNYGIDADLLKSLL